MLFREKIIFHGTLSVPSLPYSHASSYDVTDHERRNCAEVGSNHRPLTPEARAIATTPTVSEIRQPLQECHGLRR